MTYIVSFPNLIEMQGRARGVDNSTVGVRMLRRQSSCVHSFLRSDHVVFSHGPPYNSWSSTHLILSHHHLQDLQRTQPQPSTTSQLGKDNARGINQDQEHSAQHLQSIKWRHDMMAEINQINSQIHTNLRSRWIKNQIFNAPFNHVCFSFSGFCWNGKKRTESGALSP